MSLVPVKLSLLMLGPEGVIHTPCGAGLSEVRGEAEAPVQRSELRLKDIERMENHTWDLRTKEKRPNFTKDMKEELGFSEKILEFIKGGNDVRRALPPRLLHVLPSWRAQHYVCLPSLQPHLVRTLSRTPSSSQHKLGACVQGVWVADSAMRKGSLLWKNPWQSAAGKPATGPCCRVEGRPRLLDVRIKPRLATSRS